MKRDEAEMTDAPDSWPINAPEQNWLNSLAFFTLMKEWPHKSRTVIICRFKVVLLISDLFLCKFELFEMSPKRKYLNDFPKWYPIKKNNCTLVIHNECLSPPTTDTRGRQGLRFSLQLAAPAWVASSIKKERGNWCLLSLLSYSNIAWQAARV